MKKIEKLHCITFETANLSHTDLAGQACRGGAKLIQLRVKNQPFEKWLKIARQTKAICDSFGAALIINDNVQVAMQVEAAGVHLGNNDMPVAEARQLLGNEPIIGGTANTFSDIEKHHAAGADYVGIGPFRFTKTKQKLSPVLGLEGFAALAGKCREKGISLPLIGVGGIRPGNVPAILKAGMYGVAVASALVAQNDVPAAVRNFYEKINSKPV